MAAISDRDASVFKEASIPALENFDQQELEQIGRLAQELKTILTSAKQRQQDSLRKAG